LTVSATHIYCHTNHSIGIKNHGKLSAYNYLVQQGGDSFSPLVFKPTSTQEIISIIKSLKTKNSFGYDEISTKILKISTVEYQYNEILGTSEINLL